MTEFQEYWIGKDIDVDQLWRHYDDGWGFVKNFDSRDQYFLTLTFENFSSESPVFNFEAIFKSIKSVFHDLKRECLSKTEYETYGPVYVHEIRRGSEIWVLVAQQVPALLFVFAIAGAYAAVRKLDKDATEEMQERLIFVSENFPKAPDEDKIAYAKAWNFWKRKKILERMVNEGLLKVELSETKNTPTIEVP